MTMKLEVSTNTLDGKDWWFDLGVSCQKTNFHPDKTWLFSIALGFFTVYFRWGKSVAWKR